MFALSGKPDKSSEQPISWLYVEKVSSSLYMSRLSTSIKPQCLVFFPRSTSNIPPAITGFVRFLRIKCLYSTFAGLHSVFYKLWKDIRTADTSIWWCQLSVAVTELLHLSQGRGEVWPQATGGSSEPASHMSHYGTQCTGGAGLTPVEQSYWMKPLDFDSVTFLISPLTVLMGCNWISNGFAQVVKAIGCRLTCGIDYQ